MREFIIFDKQDITRIGVMSLVADLQLFEMVNVAETKDGVISNISKNETCCILLDYSLSDFTSINELKILHERFPCVSWILFSDEFSDTFLRDVKIHDLNFSILLKSCSLEEIKNGLISTSLSDQYICKQVYLHMQTLSKLMSNELETPLTQTEKEVLKEVALGKTTKEIALERNLSFHTVMTHRKNIFRKLGVTNVHEATKYAMKAGVVDVTEYYI